MVRLLKFINNEILYNIPEIKLSLGFIKALGISIFDDLVM
jgi:hypothetical protein